MIQLADGMMTKISTRKPSLYSLAQLTVELLFEAMHHDSTNGYQMLITMAATQQLGGLSATDST